MLMNEGSPKAKTVNRRKATRKLSRGGKRRESTKPLLQLDVEDAGQGSV
jgi:hypothetical protein